MVAQAEPPSPVAGTAQVTEVAAVEYMGFWIRLGAAIIDYLVMWLLFSVLSYLFAGALVLLTVPLSFLYYWLLTGLKGQTLGKMAVGIKVVDEEGSLPGLSKAALREVVGKFLSYITLYLGFLWIIFDGKKQGLHDKIANTYVVKAESGR